MDRINRAMQRSNDVELMTSGVMQEALEIFACDRAALIYPCDPDAPTFRTVMEHTSLEYGGARALGLDLPASPEWVEVARRALHHAEAVVGPGVVSGRRERYHIASTLAIAVRPKGDRPYLFAVHSARSRPWTAAGVRLFEEIARRLEDALTSVLAHGNLLASEERYSLAMEASEEGHFDTDLGTGRMFVSARLNEIYGFSRATEIADRVEFLNRIPLHPDDRHLLADVIKPDWDDAARDAYAFECRIVPRASEVRWIYTRGRVMRDAEGRARRRVGVVADITERKRAEEEHREHLWFLECMDRVNRAMQRTNDVEGVMSGVLEETLAIFGCDRAWLVYPCDPGAATCRAVMEHTRPEYPGAFALGEELPVDTQAAEVLRRVLDGPGAVTDLSVSPEIREPVSIESMIAVTVRSQGGRPVPFGLQQCSHARAWTTAERRLFEEIARRLEGALTSVLAHRNLLASQEELRQSEAYLAEAQKLSQTGSWAWSPEHDIRYWSEECYRVLSFDPQDGLPRFEEFFQRIHPDDQPRCRELVETAAREKGPFETDYRIGLPEGPVRDIHVIGRPILSASGHFVEFVGTVIDVTDRRHREQR